MGNCGSSVRCDNVYGWTRPQKMEFNADIAGIGILISFFFSALAVFSVVTWGYLTATLPSGLLQPIDQHVLMLLKSCFRRKRNHNRAEDVLSTQTPNQRNHSRVLVRFLKMLSDQQLITGISILIAALSSRCVIHRYEWHIVTSLAYFSVATHTMSLDVLRDHLAQHTWVRYCRVCFTLLFVVFFSFAFLVDQVRSDGSESQIIQCALRDWVSDYNALSDTILVLPVLAILWGKHISALIRVAAPEATYHRHVTTTLMDRIFVHFWSWTDNLSTAETARLVADAHIYYDAKIGPFRKKTRVSTWYFLEHYHEAYLSEIPVWAFQLVYGTTTTVRAVWNSNVDILEGPSMLGFGQVVAIGLLVLPLLALVEMINEQVVSEKSQPSSTQEQLHRVNDAGNSSPSPTTLELLALESSNHLTSDGVDQSVGAASQLLSEMTRKIAILSLILCAFSTVVMVGAASAASADEYQVIQRFMLMAIVPIWILSKLVIVTKRQISQGRFVWREIRSHKTKKISTQPLLPEPGTSDNSTPHIMSGDDTTHGPPRLPSLDISDDQRDHAHTTAIETSPTFGRPRRQDTEASLGLITLFNRQDGSS